MKKAVFAGITVLALTIAAAPAGAAQSSVCDDISPTIHNLCDAVIPNVPSATSDVKIVSMHESETVAGETYTYDGNCVSGPGVQKGGIGSPATYPWTLQGTATSGNAANPTISTAGECDVHYYPGGGGFGPIGTFGTTLVGPSVAYAAALDADPRYKVETCITVAGSFRNGHNGSRTLCKVFG